MLAQLTQTSISLKELKLDNPLSVAGVVIKNNQDRYLLVQEAQPKAYKLWNLPGGRCDEGETLPETAAREAKEETGIDVELLSTEPVLTRINKNGHQLNSFIAKMIGGDVQPQEGEILDVRWFSVSEIQELAKNNQLRDLWVLDSILKVEES
jgi:8-oxo-dGTP diphosphatase